MLKNGAALTAILLHLRSFTPGDCGHSGTEPGRNDTHRFMKRQTSGFQVSIIQGSTGSGKTTQVPQYILDFEAECGFQDASGCKHSSTEPPRQDGCGPKTIVVTQPRRLAAMTVARAARGDCSRSACCHPTMLRSRDGSRLSAGSHWVPLLAMRFALILPGSKL